MALKRVIEAHIRSKRMRRRNIKTTLFLMYSEVLRKIIFNSGNNGLNKFKEYNKVGMYAKFPPTFCHGLYYFLHYFSMPEM